MSFVLVSHYLRAMGHSAKKKKGGKNPKVCAGRMAAACLCSAIGLGRRKENVESSQAEVLAGKMKSAGFPLPHGILRIGY